MAESKAKSPKSSKTSKTAGKTTRKSSKSKVQKFEYQAELKQLLHLIIHSLYTHPEIFLRELISNASDATNKVRFRMLTDKEVVSPDAKLNIEITADKDKGTLSITDHGIGMTREDLINRIGTVASSGTMEFIKQLKDSEQKIDGDMIGQFGVGFYSVFMVTDQVTIETRHADKDSEGLRWVSDGQGTFTIETIDKVERGTTITFELNEKSREFCEDHRIEHIINKYSNFVDFPILLNGKEINRVGALWHRQKSEINDEELNEFYKFVSNDYQNPLGHLHLSIEGAVNFKALIFIPDTAPGPFARLEDEKSLQLYVKKIFIQDDCKELLPDYLRFLKGVVDTEDLPLNVSREVTQNSPVMAKIKNIIVGKILSYLETLEKNEPEKFEKFFSNFGPYFKMGINTDFSNRDRLIKLLRFESTFTEAGKQTSLEKYVSRMGEDDKEIFYISGENRATLERNPNLEYFKKKEIEVLLLTDPADIFIVPSLNEFEGKAIKSIDKADIEVSDEERSEEALADNLSTSLIEIFKETLGDRVEDVIESKRLVDSAVTLVVGANGLDPQMERMMKMMQKDYQSAKKILEINTTHPLIKNLSRLNLGDSKDQLLRQCILQLFEGAQLMDADLASPTDFLSRMTEIMVKATEG